MNIVICGVKGSGKTTLSKMIAENLGYAYINDYAICENKISKRKIKTFINSNDGFVIDLCFSLSPKDCFNLKNCITYFLGFVSADENLLFSLMTKKGENITLKKIKKIRKSCARLEKQCLKFGLPFVDINQDRNVILNTVMQEIKTKLNVQ